MQSKPLSLVHLVQYPTSYTPGGAGTFPTIVALHGRGSNERDLIGLAPYLPQEFLWISPRGAFSLGPDAYEWFQLVQVGRPDPARLANALETVHRFLDEVIEHYPVDKDKLFLLGFSQGTVMALSYAVSMPERVAGVVAQSAYLPLESGLQIDEVDLNQKPILLTHGMHDTVLPVDWARRSRDKLKELGANVEYHEFHMGHEVTSQSLEVIAAWLERQLAL
jgi:phospholipase/carboxylesterase